MTGAEGHTGLLSDTSFWVALSTVIFAVVAYKLGRVPLLKMLDDRTDKIRHELDEAERLRVEAQELLARYKRQHEDAVKEAEQIIVDARKQALDLQTAAEKALKDDLNRKEKQFTERLQRMEQSAIESVRDKMVDVTMTATKDVLTSTLSSKKTSASALNDDAIDILAKNIDKVA